MRETINMEKITIEDCIILKDYKKETVEISNGNVEKINRKGEE